MRTSLHKSERHILLILLTIYLVASLVHFTHNAELLGEYPNFPESWSRAHVYLAWIGMTIVGLVGWLLLSGGLILPGLFTLLVYATLGLDSLGHYLLAPMSAHTATMNATVLTEVTAAGCVFFEVTRQMVRRIYGRAHEPDA